MKTRPKELTALALAFLGIALSLPVQIMLLFGDPPWEITAIVTKLAPLNWLIIALSIAMVPLTLRASPLLWITTPLYIASVIWNNWLIASVQGSSGWLSPVHLSSIGLVLLIGGVLFKYPSCRTVLLHPSKRWWLTPERKRVDLEARLCPVLGGEISSKTFDLSESGIFVVLDDHSQWRGPRFRTTTKAPETALRVGSYCWLRVALNDVSALTCTAEIVRKTEPRGIYPAGIGLRFVGLTARDKKLLAGFLSNLKPALQAAVLAPVPVNDDEKLAA
jgi:hypothetical protein